MLSCMIVPRHPQACVECVDLVSAAETRIQMATVAIWVWALRIRTSLVSFILGDTSDTSDTRIRFGSTSVALCPFN